MHVAIAGASGFLGSHLTDDLHLHGHEVTRLVRRAPSSPEESQWDPDAGQVDHEVVERADVVVNLGGSSTVGNPHSRRWAEELRQSRVATTATLATAIARCQHPPAFLAGNGISWYGDHGDEVVTEASDTRGDALLTTVTHEWQAAADPAVEAGARVCFLRTAPVMDRASAPLKQLRLLFSLGLGGRIGNGRQHMPMVSLRDWVGAVRFLAESSDLSGPINLCCPDTPTNGEFTAALAHAVRRPSLLPVPSPALRIAAGPMAPELLGSVNARPAALERAGYEFGDQDVTDVVATALA